MSTSNVAVEVRRCDGRKVGLLPLPVATFDYATFMVPKEECLVNVVKFLLSQDHGSMFLESSTMTREHVVRR